jgi:hypothetical protein
MRGPSGFVAIVVDAADDTSLNGVFADHSHASFEAPTLTAIRRKASAFARRWAAGSPVDKCQCGPIE